MLSRMLHLNVNISDFPPLFLTFPQPAPPPSHKRQAFVKSLVYQAGIRLRNMYQFDTPPKKIAVDTKHTFHFTRDPDYFFLKKHLMEDAENSIFEPPDFKIFSGSPDASRGILEDPPPAQPSLN